jgi:hypothetical protein
MRSPMTDLPGALGTSIRSFLANGGADGVWVVEKSNWTGNLTKVCSRVPGRWCA